MILPMIGHSLLLPTNSVAEMSAVTPLRTLENVPEWMLGYYSWRGIEVPVVSIESINGEAKHPLNPQGRIAVLNNTGVDPKLPFVAIHTQGIPRMTRVAENDISEHAKQRRAFDLMAVKVGLEEFFLPNITAIEAAYLRLDLPA